MWRNSGPPQHSQMLEAWFAHLPGVIVVTPSDRRRHRGSAGAGDTVGRSVAVLRSEGDFLFGVPGDIADPIEPIPVRCRAQVVDGNAATVVSWSAADAGRNKGVAMPPSTGSRSISSTCARSGRGIRRRCSPR